MKRTYCFLTVVVTLPLLCRAEPIVLSEVRTCSGLGGWTNSMSLITTIYSRTNTTFVAKSGSEENVHIVSQKDSQDHSLRNNLLSGLVGALIAVLLQVGCGALRKCRERHSLLQAVSSECDFNLSILEEIASGVSQGVNGSYKRVKNDFFLELRKVSFQYHFTGDLYKSMARVACDEELLNRELDELQKDLLPCVRSQTKNVALGAVDGVRKSLISLRDSVGSKMNESMLSHVFKS